MHVFGIHGAFASAAKIASRCRLEVAGDPVVADQLDKLDRWNAARRNGLSTNDAAQAGTAKYIERSESARPDRTRFGRR